MSFHFVLVQKPTSLPDEFNRVLEHFDSSGETFVLVLRPLLKLNNVGLFLFLKLAKYVTLADSFTLWAR